MQGDGDDAVIVLPRKIQRGAHTVPFARAKAMSIKNRKKKGVGYFQYEIDEKFRKGGRVVLLL